MNDALKIVIDFVEGRMAAKMFEEQLVQNPELETLLNDKTLNWHGSYSPAGPYVFALELDFDDYSDILNAQGVMEEFLRMKGVPFKATKEHADSFDLILDAQPAWLDVDPEYLKQRILPEAGERSGKALKTWLKGRLRELFRYAKTPPRWLQNPEWPIGKSGPLFFLGQLKLDHTEFFKGYGAAYVFYDPQSGESEVVIQRA